MDVYTFGQILKHIYSFNGHTKDLLLQLERIYPNLSKRTLYSIVSNEIQKRTCKKHYMFMGCSDKIYNDYMTEREKQGNAMGKIKIDRKKIIKLAHEYEVPSTLVVKMILSRFFETKKEEKKIIKPSKKAISEMISKPHLIKDSDLSLETYWSVLYDDFYSPIGDIIKHQLGYEYECKLRYHCTLEKFAYKDENALKKEGYDKTPDIKLEIPVMINGSPIMWIESKALFADGETHRTYIKDQYDCYWNRWGPGLVIYWFGFTKDIIDTCEKRFVIVDQFPKSEDITPFECGILDQKKIEELKVSSCASYGIQENWDEL